MAYHRSAPGHGQSRDAVLVGRATVESPGAGCGAGRDKMTIVPSRSFWVPYQRRWIGIAFPKAGFGRCDRRAQVGFRQNITCRGKRTPVRNLGGRRPGARSNQPLRRPRHVPRRPPSATFSERSISRSCIFRLEYECRICPKVTKCGRAPGTPCERGRQQTRRGRLERTPTTEPERQALARLAEQATYEGNPVHKRNPGNFGLEPFGGPRPGKTLCDDARIFSKTVAVGLLKEGIRRVFIECSGAAMTGRRMSGLSATTRFPWKPCSRIRDPANTMVTPCRPTIPYGGKSRSMEGEMTPDFSISEDWISGDVGPRGGSSDIGIPPHHDR